MKPPTSVEIERLRGKVGQLRGDLKEAERRLEAALCDAHSFKVGDAVEAQHRSGDWRPAIVRGLEMHSFAVWHTVSWRRKDGEWAESTYNAFEKVRPA